MQSKVLSISSFLHCFQKLRETQLYYVQSQSIIMTACLLLLWHAAGSFNSWVSALEHLWALCELFFYSFFLQQTKTRHFQPLPWFEHFKLLTSPPAARFGDDSVQPTGDITHSAEKATGQISSSTRWQENNWGPPSPWTPQKPPWFFQLINPPSFQLHCSQEIICSATPKP